MVQVESSVFFVRWEIIKRKPWNRNLKRNTFGTGYLFHITKLVLAIVENVCLPHKRENSAQMELE